MKGPFWGVLRVSQYLYSGQNGHSKIDAWDNTPVTHPSCCELAISRMKRGGVEVIMASHIC